MTPISALAAHCDRVELRGVEATVCTINTRRDRLQLFLRDEKGMPFKFFSALQRHLDAAIRLWRVFAPTTTSVRTQVISAIAAALRSDFLRVVASASLYRAVI